MGPGPSRLIEAVYPGNGTTEPASSSTVKLIVPAKIAMSISPRVVPWSGKITISGRLVGGWVPRDGVALRLRVPYPGGQILQEPFRTTRNGRFRFSWTYRSGRGVVRYRFAVATTSTESDYPWAAATSNRVAVTFGRPTPTDPPRSASPGCRSMSARARGEHDWPRTTGWRPMRPVPSGHGASRPSQRRGRPAVRRVTWSMSDHPASVAPDWPGVARGRRARGGRDRHRLVVAGAAGAADGPGRVCGHASRVV